MIINDPREYHKKQLTTLGWELTVSNMLYPENSPCRELIAKNLSFGELLAEFLGRFVDLNTITHVMEVGGGYGFLMKDFLSCVPHILVTMVDISPALLEHQKKIIGDNNVTYMCMDFFEIDNDVLRQYDLIICNEIVGDFITVVDLDTEILHTSDEYFVKECKRFINQYELSINGEPFNFNLGALLAVEKLCSAGVPCFYISEHSCESQAQGEFAEYLSTKPTLNPQRIHLFGHDEYTIKFSHLVKVAQSYGYTVQRGVYNDICRCVMTPKVQFILRSNASSKDEYEIIRQFIDDMFCYEYIICIR